MSRRDRDPRDDRDRRRGDRGGREEPVPAAQRERPRPSKQRQDALNEFFVNGEGIHREVLQREICKYLGPEAYSRPSTYNGNNGYVITAVRPFTNVSLTSANYCYDRLLISPGHQQKMLDDLIELSNLYAAENREMRKRGQDISYGESETSRRQELRTGAEEPPYAERFPSQPTYAVPPPQPAYSTGPGSAAYAGSVYPSGSSYQPGPSYPATSGYMTPGHLASIRPSPNESSYTYGEEYPNPGPSYRQAPTYPSAGGYRDPREEPRAYSRADPRDTRMDPRDPRLDPRDPRLDPRDLRMDPRDPRMDPRDPRDPRLDARPDPRAIPSYPSYVTSPGDVSMHGAVDDPRAYDYVSSIPPIQSGRGGSFTPSGVVQRGYDPRDSPQMRDGYRTEPIREERRSRR